MSNAERVTSSPQEPPAQAPVAAKGPLGWLLPSLGPWSIGFVVFGTLTAVFGILELALGRLPLAFSPALQNGIGRDLRIAIVLNLLVATGPLGYRLVTRSALRSLESLRLAIDCGPEDWKNIVSDFDRLPKSAARRFYLIGAGVALLLPFVIEPGLAVYDPGHWSPETTWHRIATPIVGWMFGYITFAQLAVSSRLRRLTARLRPIDLFDLAPPIHLRLRD